MSNKIILAIDPGYDRLGWAIGKAANRNVQPIAFGCITTRKTDKISQRYLAFERELLQIITTHQPTVLAIETLFFSANKTSALQVAEARGIIISCCLRHGLEIYEYHPNTIKQTVTGNGRADKLAMEKMVRWQLKLPSEKLLDDTIDALAILMTHAIVSP